MAEFTVRRMEPRDLEAGLLLTQAQRWSHRGEDWEFHYRLGRGWVACDADDRPLGTAMWWAYGREFGTVGLVVVDPNQQGKGIGRQLMNTVIDDAGPRVLQLVATQAGLKLYQQCGFRERGGIGQHQGVPAATGAVTVPPGTVLRGISRDGLPSLYDLDAAAFGANRSHVIEAVLAAGEGVLAERDGRVAGFALMRQSGRGSLIGPLVASDETLAIALVSHLLNETQGFTRIDVPTDAAHLAAWLTARGLVCVDRVTTMTRGHVPGARAESRIFGLISQALN